MSTSTEKLVSDLRAANAPADFVIRALSDHYHDFKSPLDTPILQLVTDAGEAGLHWIAEAAKRGRYDAGREEAEAWAESPDGKRTLGSLTREG